VIKQNFRLIFVKIRTSSSGSLMIDDEQSSSLFRSLRAISVLNIFVAVIALPSDGAMALIEDD